MSRWTHNICWDCWLDQTSAADIAGGKKPVSHEGVDDVCCWCGTRNQDGIYKRAAPHETPCKGNHADELADS